jgi:hypothetical protein
MAKKKKQQQPESSSSSSSLSSSSPPAAAAAVVAAAPVVVVDAEAARLEAAYALGNFSLFRQLASSSSSSSSEAKAAVDRLMGRVVIEKEQAIVGLIGLLVVLVAAALTLR